MRGRVFGMVNAVEQVGMDNKRGIEPLFFTSFRRDNTQHCDDHAQP
jgi:hypothetical protein